MPVPRPFPRSNPERTKRPKPARGGRRRARHSIKHARVVRPAPARLPVRRRRRPRSPSTTARRRRPVSSRIVRPVLALSLPAPSPEPAQLLLHVSQHRDPSPPRRARAIPRRSRAFRSRSRARPTDRPIERAIEQSINQSTNEPTNERTNERTTIARVPRARPSRRRPRPARPRAINSIRRDRAVVDDVCGARDRAIEATTRASRRIATTARARCRPRRPTDFTTRVSFDTARGV